MGYTCIFQGLFMTEIVGVKIGQMKTSIQYSFSFREKRLVENKLTC
jgi:hypothetical protein